MIFAQFGDVYLLTSYGSIPGILCYGSGADCGWRVHFLSD